MKINKKIKLSFYVFLVLVGLALIAYFIYSNNLMVRVPNDAISVKDLKNKPIYNTDVDVYGKVNLLEEMLAPTFELISDKETLIVQYALMAEDDGTEQPAVSIENIQNHDWVVVTGQLKEKGKFREKDDFWASKIENLSNPSERDEEVGTTGICLTDKDCILFGKTGQCNCGCYYKNEVPTHSGGECYCLAPSACKCVDGECEAVF